jgi:hypothetical protein
MRAQIWLYGVGYFVLIAGSLGSAWAYRVGGNADARDALNAGIYDSRMYSYRLEQTAGKANVLGFEIRQWFAGLWHGTALAYTLAVLSFVIALGCFFVAIYLPDFPPFDTSPFEDPEGPKK